MFYLYIYILYLHMHSITYLLNYITYMRIIKCRKLKYKIGFLEKILQLHR